MLSHKYVPRTYYITNYDAAVCIEDLPVYFENCHPEYGHMVAVNMT